MRARGRVRPSKPASIWGMIVGAALVIFGLTVGISQFGAFGVVWTLFAVGITVMSAINAFSSRGIAQEVVEFDVPEQRGPRPESVEQRLARLDDMRRGGLIREDEYQEQRRRILGDL